MVCLMVVREGVSGLTEASAVSEASDADGESEGADNCVVFKVCSGMFLGM